MATMLAARRKAVRRLRPSSTVEEALQGFGACGKAEEIVLVAYRERRRDQIVPHALLAQMHLQPVGEEGDQLAVGSKPANRSP